MKRPSQCEVESSRPDPDREDGNEAEQLELNCHIWLEPQSDVKLDRIECDRRAGPADVRRDRRGSPADGRTEDTPQRASVTSACQAALQWNALTAVLMDE